MPLRVLRTQFHSCYPRSPARAVYLSNSILNQVLAGVRGPSTAVDHLHRHQNGRRDRKYGWFLNTILDAFDTAKLAVRRALKPSSKRQ